MDLVGCQEASAVVADEEHCQTLFTDQNTQYKHHNQDQAAEASCA